MIVRELRAALAPAAVPAPAADGRGVLRLVFRTWPFIRPVARHVGAVVALGAVSALFVGGLTVLATDLLLNKGLIGEKLQPLQATLLNLDSRYVGAAAGAAASAEIGAENREAGEAIGEAADEAGAAAEQMTQAQRRTVRNRLIVWVGIGSLLTLSAIGALPYYGTWVRHQINQRLRVAMIARAERLSLKYHSHAKVGDAVFRIYQDSAMIVNLVEEAVIGPAIMLSALVWGLVFIGFFSPRIALVCVAAAVPMIWLTAKYTPRIRSRVRANREANSDLTSRLQEVFTALKVVKANRAESQMLERFDSDSRRALDAAFYLRLEMALLSAAVMMVGGGLLVGTEYVLAGWVIVERETYLGAAAAAVVGFVVWNVGSFTIGRGKVEETAYHGFGLVRVWCQIQDLLIGLERAFHLLDLEPEVVDVPRPRAFPRLVQRVVYRDVAFAYGDGAPVLDGVDLEASAGTVTAIVGATGSGKSTLMSLLLRLYDPDRGAVLFNDTDIRQLRIDDIRANTAIALQKNVLFAATVADNVRYGAPDATLSDVEAAGRIACVAEFVEPMAKGYRTELGERGGKLSTGQRQRLSIARAVLRDTPILVLDEPTAALDAETEQRLLANVAQWARTRIVFLVTHRLSTIRNADQIAFLEAGRIVEIGGHDDLMARPEGRYRRFVEAEAQGAEAA